MNFGTPWRRVARVAHGAVASQQEHPRGAGCHQRPCSPLPAAQVPLYRFIFTHTYDDSFVVKMYTRTHKHAHTDRKIYTCIFT